MRAVADTVLSVEERVCVVPHEASLSDDDSSGFPSEMFASLTGMRNVQRQY